jgi:ribonuclease-3
MAGLSDWITDRGLLREALTHSSYAHEQTPPTTYNERLEFLGDSVLGLVVSAWLYRLHPDWDEGQLTKTRASLVREETLARAARRLGVGDRLRLGRGELLTGGRDKPSLLADAFEALTAAAYLSGGLDAAEALVRAGLEADLATGPERPRRLDHKTALGEALRRRGLEPEYRLVQESGPDHAKWFVIAVRVGEEELGRGQGRSKKEAEQHAAKVAMRRLEPPPA